MKTKLSTKEDYIQRINKVVEYINNHLNEEMDLRRLAEISNFSEFHFHRIFKAFRHETLSAYVIRTRIETAALLLSYSELPVETIACNVGYEIPSSFSKSFKQFYGISPTEYRNNKNKENYVAIKQEVLNPEITSGISQIKLKVPKLIELESKTVIYIHFTGAYKNLDFPETFAKLWNFVKEHKLFSAGIEHLGVYYDDPHVTESGKLRSDICLAIHKSAQSQGEIRVKEISGGKYAVFSYQGPYSNFGLVYDAIFAEWLPTSGYELRNLPIFEKYCNDPSRTEPEKLKTEIYIPIQ
ncbi:MAG: AraC family transcriptional regulator [Dysgonamonadaceae bacterium]|jgi:AraC family transcriptional regulator|nr:AraC family transcriptional regulator [Dysgonamonadaceae bacterium]